MATISPISAIDLPSPLTLRLPFWLAREFSIKRLLAKNGPRPWSESRPLVDAFAHSGPERRFVRRLLLEHRHWWVFRCHQKAFCGDFVLVDMSPPPGYRRSAIGLELKISGPLIVGGGGVGNQFQNSPMAFDDVANQLPGRGPFRTQLIAGGADEVLSFLHGFRRRKRKRHSRRRMANLLGHSL